MSQITDTYEHSKYYAKIVGKYNKKSFKKYDKQNL